MDRRIRAGVIGLVCAWLDRPCDDKHAHDAEKARLSDPDGKLERDAGRHAFLELAEQFGRSISFGI